MNDQESGKSRSFISAGLLRRPPPADKLRNGRGAAPTGRLPGRANGLRLVTANPDKTNRGRSPTWAYAVLPIATVMPMGMIMVVVVIVVMIVVMIIIVRMMFMIVIVIMPLIVTLL